MFMVVWTLILRGISIEFRSHLTHPMWRQFWDFVFGFASTLMPILLGCALANIVRGVTLDATGFFNIPLFTSFRPSDPQPGILDIYTVFVGLFALVMILAHGASFLAWKTEGEVSERARAIRQPLFVSAMVMFAVVTMLTMTVRASIFAQAQTSPIAWFFALVTLASVGSFFFGHRLQKDIFAFLGTSGTILGLLGATAASVFPVMLKSTLGEQFDLTALNASSDSNSLATGMRWWFVGFPIAVAYFAYIFYLHRDRAKPAADGEGY
jgi:cytochrome d ubiquinol oxidase subunit II